MISVSLHILRRERLALMAAAERQARQPHGRREPVRPTALRAFSEGLRLLILEQRRAAMGLSIPGYRK